MSPGTSAAPRHWGLPLFLACAAAAGLGSAVDLPSFPPGLTLGLLGGSAVLPFLSFPRVPNFRLDFLALNLSAAGLLWARGWRLHVDAARFEASLGLVILLTLAVSSLVPAQVRGGRGPQILILTLVAGALLIYLLGQGEALALPPVLDVPAALYLPALIFLAGLALSLTMLASHFGLGGGVSGLSVFGLALTLGGGAAFRPALPGLFAAALFLVIAYVWVYRLRFRVSYDPLMQIYNRAHADQILHSPPLEHLGAVGAVGMVDLDHFKHLNDRHGHAMGDKVLHAAAQAIRREALPSGIVCRYGGEEIIVFLPQTSDERAVEIFESIRKGVEKLKLKDGRRTIHPTCSVGWAVVSGDTEKPVSYFVEKADQALYRAKDQGRNRVVRG